MFALEVINAINKPEAPKMPTGATMRFSGPPDMSKDSLGGPGVGYSDRCPGACGSVKGHPRHGKCDAGWPPNDAEGRGEMDD